MLVRQVQVEQQQVGAQPVHRRDRLGRRMRLRNRLESVHLVHIRSVDVRDAEVVVDDYDTDHGVTRAFPGRLPGPATAVAASSVPTHLGKTAVNTAPPSWPTLI